MEKNGAIWEPYFKPTRRVHDSGFRCFECGYLQVSKNGKTASKKIVIGTGVDHISNWLFSGKSANVDFDLLKDGHIRIFNYRERLYWYIPGFSDAKITNRAEEAYPDYETLDELYEKQLESKEAK